MAFFCPFSQLAFPDMTEDEMNKSFEVTLPHLPCTATVAHDAYLLQAAGAKNGTLDLKGFEQWCSNKFGDNDNKVIEGITMILKGDNSAPTATSEAIAVLAEGLGMDQADVDEIMEDVVKELEEDDARGNAEKLQQEQVCRRDRRLSH